MKYTDEIIIQIIEVFDENTKIEYTKYHKIKNIASGGYQDIGEGKTYIATVVYFGLTNKGETIPLVVEDGEIKPVWSPYKLIGMDYMSKVIKTETKKRL